jgi:hypothetical protein
LSTLRAASPTRRPAAVSPRANDALMLEPAPTIRVRVDVVQQRFIGTMGKEPRRADRAFRTPGTKSYAGRFARSLHKIEHCADDHHAPRGACGECSGVNRRYCGASTGLNMVKRGGKRVKKSICFTGRGRRSAWFVAGAALAWLRTASAPTTVHAENSV